ncbi:MAG: NUDIX hydrolase [Chloroflexi bacterium]|nr:NUDIX hydrolase [Chloroflexota bacterium]
MSRVDANELAELTARFGAPVRWTRALDVTRETIAEWRDATKKRQAEIVLALPRPGKRVLLHTKDFYPSGVFRVPSGGIHLGERVEDAARREMREETGFTAPLTRLLGIIEYEFRHAEERVPFVSYVFLADETHDAPHPMDAGERITQFREAVWSDLPRLAQMLDDLPEDWRDWGRFRAIAHRLIADFKF